MSEESIASNFFSGTGTKTFVFPIVCNELVIVNDGYATLTFAAGDKFTPSRFALPLSPGDAFDERIEAFDRVTVTATGDYHGYIRRSPNEYRWSSEYLYK
ncbi:hypothetical protein ACFPYJ_17680 [Paenibacillus solisilvae]|uniref:Uncharacterized protein n=1 Tax=Paenibacillus solisilvae TaxID=2486751 RepID=A0ABW0VYA1_9BACL